MDLDAQSKALVETMWGDFSHSDIEKFRALEKSKSSATQVKAQETGAPNSPPSKNTKNHLSRRGSDALVDDSLAMHRQAHSLLRQGRKLVAQGKLLLETIFGNKTDEYIRNVAQHRSKAGNRITNTTDAHATTADDHPKLAIDSSMDGAQLTDRDSDFDSYSESDSE